MSSLSRQNVPHSYSHVLTSEHRLLPQAPMGGSEPSRVTAARVQLWEQLHGQGPLGLKLDGNAPSGWETAPGNCTEALQLLVRPDTHQLHRLSFPHHMGVLGPFRCPGVAETWVVPGWCLCRHGWQHPGQGPVSFLP